MTYYVARPPIKSGVPLGGLGTGSIELRPDGELHAWQIANPERFRKDCRKNPNADDGENLTGSLSFFLRTETNSDILLRRLGFGTDDNNCRMYSLIKPISAIEYHGTFPTVSITYRDEALPVEISLEAASPFVPYEEDIAGTPGIFLTFTVRNRSDQPVRVSLAGKQKSFVSAGKDGLNRRCRILKDDTFQGICSESIPSDTVTPDTGSIFLSASGGDISVLSGEYRGYMNEYVAHGTLGVSEESFLFDLHRTGRLPDTSHSSRLDSALLSLDTDQISDEAVQTLWNTLLNRACAASIAERLHADMYGQISDSSCLRDALNYLLKNLRELHAGEWGDGALCVCEELAPRETKDIPFLLSWHFPSLYSAAGAFVGHRYAVRFSDAVDAGAYLWKYRSRILQKVRAFRETLYNSSFPEVFSDAVSIHLSTLVKCSWWAENGDFGIWEGLGSCGLHTTDISYHGSFGICALFPRLEHGLMRMTAAKMRPDGAVPHFFSPDFTAVDDGFDRVDLNPQFVLLVCRDWIATGNRQQLETLWPAVCAAMNRTFSLDRNGDGLPDTDTQRNTYDSWRFSGTPAYVSILWLAALKAAIRIAEDLSKKEHAVEWRTLLSRGTDSVLQLLWNGSYFDLWRDGLQRDECCMTDQLDGEFFCRLIGLGGLFDDRRVGTVLDTIYRTNFSPERGLINAGCPAGKHTTSFTFRNCQGEANWSGIEYWFAAHLLLTGSYERGLQLVQTVQERYERLGQTWNHAECGDYYYRPLSSFVLLPAVSGFLADAASETFRFGSAVSKKFHIPFFTPNGYGIIRGTENSREVTVLCGTLAVQKLLPPEGNYICSITCSSRDTPFTAACGNDGSVILSERMLLAEGKTFKVNFRSL